MDLLCPNCQSADITWRKKKACYICEDCDHEFTIKKEFRKLKIFLSYGHDSNEELVKLIKSDLEKRGHDVWFDREDIKTGQNWRRSITDGINESNKVISFLSKYGTRDPGVCLDEIAIALGVKGGNIQTILVESEKEVQAPTTLSHIQWLDMHDWKQQQSDSSGVWNQWYGDKLAEIIEVVESEESRRFAGEIEQLRKYLKPISSDARIKLLLSKGFVGREWLLEELENWRTMEDRTSRLFWIMGKPGVGKSAFSAYLSHFGKEKVIASQFCEFDKPDHHNPAKVVRSIAFQLATRLPEYRKLLLDLPEINELDDKKTSAELFKYLLAEPLQYSIDGGQERYLVLIDALDEAKENEGNPLVEMLAENVRHLPPWLAVVVTSRPEKNVIDPFQGLSPFIIETDKEENRQDIIKYIELQLQDQLVVRKDPKEITNQILEKSEGVFLYVERVCNDVRAGNLDLDKLEKFPVGLGGIYWQFFKRQFPDIDSYRRIIRPALRLILAAFDPLTVSLLRNIQNWGSEDLNDFSRALGSLFPVIIENGVRIIKPYHKSVIEWITQEGNAGQFFVSMEEGHQSLTFFGWNQYINGVEKLDLYFIKWLPRHLTLLANWDNVTELLCDLDFIQAKACAELTYDLVKDYHFALNSLPEYQPEKEKERRRQIRLDKYAQDLIAVAKGELCIDELDIPESIIPLSQERINMEIERIIANPNRVDILKDFINFFGQEASNIQKYASDFDYFTHQQAWNYAAEGPVGKSTEKLSAKETRLLLRYTPFSRPSWNIYPQSIQFLKKHNEGITAVGITSNGKIAISTRLFSDSASLWDMESGKAIKSLQGNADGIYSLAITPDGRAAISGTSIGSCILWDIESGNVLRTLKGHTQTVNALAITSDGKLAVSASFDTRCIFWDLERGKALFTFKEHTRGVNAIDIIPNGKFAISGSDDKTCIVWDLESGKAFQTLTGHTGTVNAVAMTPNGKLAISGSSDKTCLIWDVGSGKSLKNLKGHTSSVNAVAITPDGKLALSGSDDNSCILWNVESEKVLHTLKGHSSKVTAVAITPDGKQAISGSDDKSCIIWELLCGKETQSLKTHSQKVNVLGISPDRKIAISGSDDNTNIVWDLESGKAIQTLTGHTGSVNALAITRDGKLAISGSNDKTCLLWDLERRKPIHTLRGHFSGVVAVAITPDGKQAISIGRRDTFCILWDIPKGLSSNILKGHSHYVTIIAITPDGKKAISGSNDFTCRLWDLQYNKPPKVLKGHTDCITALIVSPDGKTAISGSWDTSCILWNLQKGTPIKTLKGHKDIVQNIDLHPEGNIAVTCASDNTCIIWDLRKGEPLFTLSGHTDPVRTVAISQDGKTVISCAEDKACIAWDLKSGRKLAQFIRNEPISSMALNTDLLILGEDSGAVSMIKGNKALFCPGIPICTIRSVWDSEFKRYHPLSVDCPICGYHFAPQQSVVKTIKRIAEISALLPEQSPCLELPEDAWQEPGLLNNCPKCMGKLQFNPFIVGGMDKEEDRLIDLHNRRNIATSYYEKGDYLNAKALYEQLLKENFATVSTRIHLSRIAIVMDDFPEASYQVNEVWKIKSEVNNYVLARALWFKLLLFFLNPSIKEDTKLLLGQIKYLLKFEDTKMDWTVGPMLYHIKNKIPDYQFDLLVLLATALSTGNSDDLENIKEWKGANSFKIR